MKSVQVTDFSQGMFYLEDRTRIPQGGYHLLVNGRTRYNSIQTIQGPRDITEDLEIIGNDNLQGIYSFGDFVLVFRGGYGYFENFKTNPNGTFKRLQPMTLQHDAERIYAAPIPASTVNLTRKLQTVDDATSGVEYGVFDSGSEQCAIICDGVNQPWVVFPDGSNRQTRIYSEWDNSDGNREYVPVGIKPVFHGGILYLLGKDDRGNYTLIFRSVTGRPLDFMVNIDVNGNRLPQEEEGGARSVSHSVGLEEITSFYPSSLENRGLIVSTRRNTWFVIPDTQNTIFGEPTFINQGPLFQTGPVTEKALAEMNSDTVFVDQVGLRSFNDIQVSKNEGRNRPFSERVRRLFDGKRQSSNAAVINYEDYLLFSVETSYGPSIIVFDTITERFVGIDSYQGFGQVTQFAVLKIEGEQRLFGITTNNKVIELFSGDREVCRYYHADLDGSVEGRSGDLKITSLTVGCSKIATGGALMATYFVDGVREVTTQLNLTATQTANISEPFPYLPNLTRGGMQRVLDFTGQPKGRRAGLFIETDADVSIDWLDYQIEDSATERNSIQDREDIILSSGDNYPFTLTYHANNFELSGDSETLIELAKGISPDLYLGGGNHVTGSGGSLTLTSLQGLLDYENTQRKLKYALGPLEYDQSNGKDLLEYILGDHYARYTEYINKNVQVFLLSSGYDSGGSVVEPHGVDMTSRQYRWFEEKVRQSTARFKIVMLHHAPYSSFISSPKTALRWNFDELGVDLVLTGEGHGYERLVVDNIPYVNIYSGNTLASLPTPIEGSLVRDVSASHFLKLEVDSFNIYAKVIDTNENVIDQFIIHA